MTPVDDPLQKRIADQANIAEAFARQGAHERPKVSFEHRVGLAAVRIQPLHRAHTGIINEMIQECETVIIALGSANKSREKHDPWTIDERMKMLRNVYGDRLKIVPLNDLGTTQGSNDWVDYVLDKVAKVGLPDPTDYFTGSEADAIWYRERFFRQWFSPVPDGLILDEIQNEEPAFNDYYTKNGILRRLHIRNREMSFVPSATELRMFLETRNDGWKKWVPSVNHDLVTATYPEEFRVRTSG